MTKSLPILLISYLLTACASSNYSIVAGEYGWNKKGKNGSKNSKYSSVTMYKINSKTGESWRMTFEKHKGYYWEPINHLNIEPVEK